MNLKFHSFYQWIDDSPDDRRPGLAAPLDPHGPLHPDYEPAEGAP